MTMPGSTSSIEKIRAELACLWVRDLRAVSDSFCSRTAVPTVSISSPATAVVEDRSPFFASAVLR